MNRPANELNKNTSLSARLLLATLLMTATSVSMADDANVAYVDSVLKWGAWELDIEPAAGGISAPTTRALNARSSKVALRTNSIAALAPPGAGTPANPIVPGTPVPQRPPTPILPVRPPVPTIPTTPFVPTAPTSFAPPGATPPTGVTLAPSAPIGPAPSGAVAATVVTLP